MPPKLLIDILVPTRDRPEDISRLLNSIAESAADPKSITASFYIDDDDEPTCQKIKEMQPEMEKMPIGRLAFIRGPQTNLAACYNQMATYTYGDIIMYAADDITFETKGWDEVVRNAFLASIDRIWLFWAYDPARTDPFPDHGFISRWSKNVLRYVFPVFPPHPKIKGSVGIAFTDIWLKEVYEQMGRLKQLTEIEIRHRHWTTTEEFDDNYVFHAVMQNFYQTPEFGARRNEIPEHCERLKKFLRWWDKKLEVGPDKWPERLARQMAAMPEGWHEKWKAGHEAIQDDTRAGQSRAGNLRCDSGIGAECASPVDG